MQDDDPDTYMFRAARQTSGASALAQTAVTELTRRQGVTPSGARQFILDHMMRSILSRGDFDPNQMLTEMRGHRLSVDAVIDIYVPAAARILGEMWQTDDIDFASVTVGSMRLQALLSIASVESLDFVRPLENAMHMVIAVPLGEQHTLGAFVLGAQLRRLGVRVDVSFCERAPDFASRVLCDPPEAILFTASCRATLETVSQLVLNARKILPGPPVLVLGGSATGSTGEAKEISGVDLVTQSARDVVSFTTQRQTRMPDQARR
ncbi:MAG: B12-binding domain-containing protein [Paracoccaceae bacterium]